MHDTNTHTHVHIHVCMGFPGRSVVKNLPVNAGDTGSIPGSGRSPGGGHGNPFQYSCLENPKDRGAWRATFHGVTKSQMGLKQLSMLTPTVFNLKYFR